MLRVQTEELINAVMIRLEGRLTGEGADHVRSLVSRCEIEMEIIVDLTELLFVDALGEQVLSFLKKLGAQFVADTAYSRDICERLDLPPVRNDRLSNPLSEGSNGNGR